MNEPIAYFTETVINRRPVDHLFHWVQHVTLGPPFLTSDQSVVAVPGRKAATYPHGYDEGKALLLPGREFRWPDAPMTSGRTIDLTRPFQKSGLGFVVSVLLDRDRRLGFVAAVNQETGVMLAYCFRRADFPWVAVWEENRALSALPWRSRTQARGLEFGTTPFPLERRESFSMGKLFGEPTSTCVEAKGRKTVRYLAFLAKVPKDFGNVRNIELISAGIRVSGEAKKLAVLKTPYPAKFLGPSAMGDE